MLRATATAAAGGWGGAGWATAGWATAGWATTGLLMEGCQRLPPPARPVPRGRQLAGALEVRGPRFFRDDQPFFVRGFNYWSALPLARPGTPGGWDRLRRDLDQLQAAGINTLRIIAATEGPDTAPLRIVPTLQPAPGQFDAASVTGLLRLVRELEQRKLFAILILNNFWPWSGGMAQYLAWAGEGPIPYPPPVPGGSWSAYQAHTARFYSSDRAMRLYDDLLGFLVPQLRSSPAVIWELANEPRGIDNVRAFRRWIDRTAALIKTLAPSQLVTTGSEGQTPSPFYAGLDVIRDHESPNIDFITFHLWPQNWGWVKPDQLERSFPRALERSRAYVADHAARAAKLNKPLLLEEFGFPRDGGSCDPGAPTTMRDRFFEAIYSQVESLMPTTPMAGAMPWAWSGDARPPRPGQYWKPGDPFIGDPPHEPQGWYGIYASDSTVRVVRAFAGGPSPTSS